MLVFGFRRRLFILEEDVTLGLVVNQQTLPEYKRCHYTFAPSLKECQPSAENLLILMSLLLGTSESFHILPSSPPSPQNVPEHPQIDPKRPKITPDHSQSAPNSPQTRHTVLDSPQSSIGHHPNTPESTKTTPNSPRMSSSHPKSA